MVVVAGAVVVVVGVVDAVVVVGAATVVVGAATVVAGAAVTTSAVVGDPSPPPPQALRTNPTMRRTVERRMIHPLVRIEPPPRAALARH